MGGQTEPDGPARSSEKMANLKKPYENIGLLPALYLLNRKRNQIMDDPSEWVARGEPQKSPSLFAAPGGAF